MKINAEVIEVDLLEQLMYVSVQLEDIVSK